MPKTAPSIIVKTADDCIWIRPLVTSVIKPPPNGKKSSLIGAPIEFIHNAGSRMMNGRLAARKIPAIEIAVKPVFLKPKVRNISTK